MRRRGAALPRGRHAWQRPGHMPFQGCLFKCGHGTLCKLKLVLKKIPTSKFFEKRLDKKLFNFFSVLVPIFIPKWLLLAQSCGLGFFAPPPAILSERWTGPNLGSGMRGARVVEKSGHQCCVTRFRLHAIAAVSLLTSRRPAARK